MRKQNCARPIFAILPFVLMFLNGFAHAQIISVSPQSIPFANQAVNTTSSTAVVTLLNNQASTLNISNFQISAPFAQTNNCGAAVAPNAQCTFNVTFSPTAKQFYSSTLVITDDSANSPHSIALTGNGVIPITFSPGQINFPNQPVGSSSNATSVTMNNNLSVALPISNIQATAPFAQTNNCGTSLAAGSSCTLSVTFSPTAVQTYSSTLKVTDSDPSSPQSLALTGSGSLPVTFSPKTISFPNQPTNSTSSAIPITVTNSLPTALTISGITIAAPFAETDNCGTSLAAGSSCTVNVTFTPTAVKFYSAGLSINDSALTSPQVVSLSGSGYLPVKFSPLVISFPQQATGTTSAASPITVTNAQPVPLNISSIQTSTGFAQTNNCGTSLPGGQSCTVNVTFSPTAVQFYNGSLTITDGATNSPQNIGLGGNGVVPVLIIPKVGGLYFNHQIVSTTSTPQPITLTNNLSTPLAFSGIASSAIFPLTSNCGDETGGGTLAPGASCTIQVSFAPAAVTNYTVNLSIADNAPGSPQLVPLQGAGIAGSPGTTITVKPPAACIPPSGSEQFTIYTTGLTNPAVKWYVSGVLGGNATVGKITPSGLYTAPTTAKTYTVTAVTQTTPSVTGSVNIAVTTTPSYGIYPFVASIPVGAQQTFQAQLCQVPDNNVTFTVDNIAGGNSKVGVVSSSGVYTAPTTAGKHTVRAIDSSLGKTSGGVVTVFSSITADFASRANNTAPVPANVFGYGRGESIVSTNDRNLFTQAGLNVSRMSAQIYNVFASSSTPNWKLIDPLIATVQASGQHAVLQLNQSPVWLQPTSGTCKGNAFAAPTDINAWTQLAVQIVAHMDTMFPGVVTDYEIWNEPNSTGLCTSANHLTTYLSMYGTAAPAMKAQAAQDGTSIRIGGPVLSGYSALWFENLLTNPATAPYVDFLSYHQYFFGPNQLQVQWDTYTGDVSLYEATQDVSNGVSAVYNRVVQQAAAGKQPLGIQTPIYVTEFNTNWAFFNDCCRNNATYAPVWNALYVTDMLNTVYSGTAHVPNGLQYFAGSAYPWFCMVGVQDANMDCLYSVGATPVPYPQYYAYQLIASSQYLGLSAGGYMAKSISTPTGGGGLATTAFYTANKDAIVITNPTSAAYSQITVNFANAGLTGTQGTLYTVVNGAQISSTPISFAVQGANLTTTVSVPAYSVQAVSLP